MSSPFVTFSCKNVWAVELDHLVEAKWFGERPTVGQDFLGERLNILEVEEIRQDLP